MFYRRKILLALLEVCGGQLNSTDMEKLLFAFCKERGVNYYDFFPYRYGSFSFLSYQDKRVLTQQGYLHNVEGFVMKFRKSSFAQLDVEDKRSLRDFAIRTKDLRGNALIRWIYLHYPYYACRSEIKDRILSTDEQALVHLSAPKYKNPSLLTIGYEGLTIDSYIDKLIRHSVSTVIDVRRNPISMKYGFSKTRFQSYLERAGIAYEHIPELGVASSQRKKLETPRDYQSLFNKYAKALPRFTKELTRLQQILETKRRVALTCFESGASSCHRHKITEYLETLPGWDTPVFHIA